MMKRTLYYIIIGVTAMLTSCDLDYSESIDLSQLTIQLTADDGRTFAASRVELRGIWRDVVFVEQTDASGAARFVVPPGLYEASSSAVFKPATNLIEIANGTSGQIIVNESENTSAVIRMMVSKVSQLVIKEVYNGGIRKDDGKVFQYDKNIVIYNNSSQTASYDNLCFAICAPYNSQANNKWYGSDGKLVYEAESYLPAIDGIWYFPQTLTIAPYQQVVVNVQGAIDNTLTYPNSVNYAHADYYCMYDPEAGYTNANYYPTPASVIPPSHYLKAVKIGVSNAWALSLSSPALILFQVKETTPQAFATDVRNLTYVPGSAQTDINKVAKIPVDWVLDGIEVFAAGYKSANMKRLTASVDAGFVELTNQLGHTLYRNVDREATEQLAENADKLVYNYALGVAPSTDPSGIDAEASVRNGAHIVYMDTNNSSTDFHERQKSSLRE